MITPKQKKAWDDIQNIARLLEAYNRNYRDPNNPNRNEYPTTTDGLTALRSMLPYNDGINPIITSIPTQDPWGHNYVYVFPGEHGDYDLASYVANGQPGVRRDNNNNNIINPEDADITSWAEASLVGTWHEYTPTSAMDIAFNEKRPDA